MLIFYFIWTPYFKHNFKNLTHKLNSSNHCVYCCNYDHWCIKWIDYTTSDKEWQRVVQLATSNGTTSDNEWYRVVTSANFPLFRIKKAPATKHLEENSLSLKDNKKTKN